MDLTDATRWLQFIAKINECHSKIIELQFPSDDYLNNISKVSGGVQIFTLRRNSPLSTGVEQEESVDEKIAVESEEVAAKIFVSHLQLEVPSQVDLGVRQLLPVKHPTTNFSFSPLLLTFLKFPV